MSQIEENPLKEESKDPEAGKQKAKTLKEKFLYIKENYVIEPVLAFYVLSGTLSRLGTQNLNLDKACRVNLNFGDKVCDALVAQQGDSYQEEEKAVQELIASMEIWKTVLMMSIPSVLILFLGAWSDRTRKRKICILLPLVGELLMCLSNMLNTFYFHEIPVQITMFMEAIFPAITGAWVTTYMGIFSYISDVTTEETRTFRMGIVNLCLTAGGPLGSALSGILLEVTGYYGVFGISSVFYIVTLIYGFLYITDPVPPNLDKYNNVGQSAGVCGFLKSFFDLNHVKDTFLVALKKGPNNRRLKLALVFLVIKLLYGPAYGENTIKYLFTRYKFQWDALKYSFYTTFYICLHGLGALISISIFSRRLKWDDSVLGLISSVCKVAGGLTTGLAVNSFQMYLGAVVETFNATSYTALRSISSKLVANDELGKMTSLFNLMEVVTIIIYGPLYSWLYLVTLSIDAGFVYFISTVITIPAVFIFIWFYIQHRKEVKIKRSETQNLNNIKHEDNADIILNSLEVPVVESQPSQ